MSDIDSYRIVLERAVERLKANSIENAELDARLLLQFAADLNHSSLIGRLDDPMPDGVAVAFDQCLSRRISREPVHRILGRREFYGLDLELSRDTLEPRPDTECLVDAVLKHLDFQELREAGIRFADLGSGSGAIVLALLNNLPNAKALATDISQGALQITSSNAQRLGLHDRLDVLQSDWFSNVQGQFQFIVSNPPYISSEVVDGLSPEVLRHDPRRALDGGADGLTAYRALLKDAARFLASNGFLALEIGFDQADSLRILAKENSWRSVDLVQDLGGQDRVIILEPLF